MWPIVWAAVRSYAPYVVWPAAALIGFVGYNIEWTIRDEKKSTPWRQSIQEERILRQIENKEKNPAEVESLTAHKYEGRTIFDKNKPQRSWGMTCDTLQSAVIKYISQVRTIFNVTDYCIQSNGRKYQYIHMIHVCSELNRWELYKYFTLHLNRTNILIVIIIFIIVFIIIILISSSITGLMDNICDAQKQKKKERKIKKKKKKFISYIIFM